MENLSEAEKTREEKIGGDSGGLDETIDMQITPTIALPCTKLMTKFPYKARLSIHNKNVFSLLGGGRLSLSVYSRHLLCRWVSIVLLLLSLPRYWLAVVMPITQIFTIQQYILQSA